METIIEPFRIKMTEPLSLLTREERVRMLQEAHYNVFLLRAQDCTIDLLTDSGTGAMSTKQWAALLLGDESYAGSRSWFTFRDTVKSIAGMPHIFPTHQGRAAESILAEITLKPGNVVPNNSHFDTTRANFEYAGAKAVNLLCSSGYELHKDTMFKGNMDVQALEKCIEREGADNIPFAMITITNNAGGGQPVSMDNIRQVKELLKEYNIPLVLDACRFAENAYFIQQYEEGYANKSLFEIARETFLYADAATMSLKKDGLANIGGFFVCRDNGWAEAFQNLLILREGFPTYGGLAGRDLEVAAVGLQEVLEEDYQKYRHATVEYVHKRMIERGIPVVRPAGGHAVFIDAKRFMPHIAPREFPGVALINALYELSGIRAVELGSLMFGKVNEHGKEQTAPMELVRLAFPRRVYTQSHFDFLIESLDRVWANRSTYRGYQIVSQPKYLRHFSCRLSRL